MIQGKKVCVVMPAHNAQRTVEKTVAEIDRTVVDEIIVVDDHSRDETAQVLAKLPVTYAVHSRNLGYGGNQKTCYSLALSRGADIVIMVHADYQYDPKLVPVMAHMVASGLYDVVIASRILGKGALKGGMPLYKYLSNRFLTLAQNLLIGQKLSEYHTGYRAFSRRVLEALPLTANSDNFVFDNQMLVQCFHWGFTIGETSCPTKYFPEASSINFTRACRYGLGVLLTSLQGRLASMGIYKATYLRKEALDAHGLSGLKLDSTRIVATNLSQRLKQARRP